MGRLEKIVVTTVVFLIIVILAVSLGEDDGATGPVDETLLSDSDGDLRTGDLTPPWAADRDAEGAAEALRSDRSGRSGRIVAPAPRASAGGRRSEESAELGAAGGLAYAKPNGNDASVSEDLRSGSPSALGDLPDSPRVAALDDDATSAGGRRGGRGLLSSTLRAAADVPEGSVLVTLEGLVPTTDDEFMIYTWETGDTFTKVVRRLYGDLSMVRLLRTANEDLTDRDLSSGDRILVPVFDRSPRLRAGGDAYTVLGGDTLSSIARKVYGDSSLYMKIFEANRDVLSHPDSVAEGQNLRIPR